jgi:PrtD family type I secretion system ABC transporter
MAFSAAVNILYLAPTLYMLQVYDRVTPTGSLMTLTYVTLVVAYALATLSLLDHVRQRLLVRVGLRLDRLLSAQILSRLMARARGAHGSAMVGQAMRDFDVFRQSLSGQAALTLFDLPWTPIYVAAAFLLHPALGFLTLFGGGVLLALNLANQRVTRTRLQEAHRANAQAYLSQDSLAQNAEAIRALGMRGALINRQEAERAVGLSLSAQGLLVGGRYAALTKFVRLFLQSAALAAGAWLAVNKQISAGSIIAASVLMARALQPVEQIVASWSAIMQGRSAYDNLCALFAETEGDDAQRTQLPRPAGHLQVERVLSRAPGSLETVLRDVSFALEPGAVLGIIGASGAGKTTLARVIAGALAPDAGVVRIDGASMSDWDGDALAGHIGYLPQNPILLAGTVKENISRFAFWAGGDSSDVEARHAASGTADQGSIDRKAIEAAQAAGAHEIILRLPQGYDTRLGPGGVGLSAGQTQRIALARALYGAPALLVLDEPNSALDAQGEAALMAAIETARNRGAALVIVAHRAGVLNLADQLLVLNEGSVAHWGPRASVIAQLSAAEARGQTSGPPPARARA